jgi:hypothetical protein
MATCRADRDAASTLFDFHSSARGSGNFQLGVVQRTAGGARSMALGAFHFHSLDERRRFLFGSFAPRQIHRWMATQRVTLNADFYAPQRAPVIARLAENADKCRADLKLRSR